MALEFSLTFVCSAHSNVSSEMLCFMVDHETGTSTQPHIVVWTSEFCPHFFTFHGTHTTPNSSSKGQCLLCRASSQVNWLVEGVCFPRRVVCS
jgi:hypothetical protein